MLIDRLGPLRRSTEPDLFAALVHAIIAQQISGRAAQSISDRLLEAAGALTAERLASLEPAVVRGCGLSERKVSYIRRLAEAVGSGGLDLETLRHTSDAEVIRRLADLDGIGVWTAEMLLIFSLCRPDVLSWGDFGIRRGMALLYGDRQLTRVSSAAVAAIRRTVRLCPCICGPWRGWRTHLPGRWPGASASGRGVGQGGATGGVRFVPAGCLGGYGPASESVSVVSQRGRLFRFFTPAKGRTSGGLASSRGGLPSLALREGGLWIGRGRKRLAAALCLRHGRLSAKGAPQPCVRVPFLGCGRLTRTPGSEGEGFGPWRGGVPSPALRAEGTQGAAPHRGELP